ncbi:MAG TPA: argininosuccinate lyase [Vicinamibacterales bacterium]|nr:argininosuccinate lyase [Vicinamibacterales bacterium]
MTTLWNGRFAGDPHRGAFEFGRSLPFDRRLFEEDVTGSLAWAGALAAAGVLDRDEHERLARALEALLERFRADPSLADTDDEDVHSLVERLLVEEVGDAGRRLHTGRSRNDQVSLDLRLYLRRRIPLLQGGAVRLAAALIEQAERAGGAVMPAYTHARRAQPVLVAHYLLAHVAALRRDHARLASAADEADALPLGSGAVAGSAFAVDVAGLARRLGFSRLVANSIDASSDRDFVSSFLHGSALLMVHLSRLAEDLVLFTGEEYGFFELADEVSTGSSMLPQKKNPDPLELVRGKSGRVIGRLAGWLATMKGLPSGYNKDLQEDKEAVFEAEDTVAASLAAAETVVRTLRLDERRTAAAAGGLLLATDIADYLARRGEPFRGAHALVGRIVRDLLPGGRDFGCLSLAEWRAYSDRFGADIIELVSPAASVAAKRTPQSTNPAEVRRALMDARAWVAAHEATS